MSSSLRQGDWSVRYFYYTLLHDQKPVAHLVFVDLEDMDGSSWDPLGNPPPRPLCPAQKREQGTLDLFNRSLPSPNNFSPKKNTRFGARGMVSDLLNSNGIPQAYRRIQILISRERTLLSGEPYYAAWAKNKKAHTNDKLQYDLSIRAHLDVRQGSWQRKDEQAEQDNVYSSETRTEKQMKLQLKGRIFMQNVTDICSGIKKWYARHSI